MKLLSSAEPVDATPAACSPAPSSAWPYYEEDEIAAVVDVLRSGNVNYWTGDECREFEREYADFFGVRLAVALANGTVALEVALRALGIGAGDEVVVTPRSFIASASAIVSCGGTPVFCDIDRESGNITADTIAPVLTSRTRAIITVHLAGWPCEMDPIIDLARAHGLAIIEDCAQSHGAKYKGRYAGSFGDIAAWSFCQDKIISTGGEGGMTTTNNAELWNAMWSLKDHGKSWRAMYHGEQAPGFRWVHESFGSNGRMTEMQAAIGRRQLQKLNSWVARRQHNAQFFRNMLSEISALRIPTPPEHMYHAYYKFYAYIRPEALKNGWTRDRILSELLAHDIRCGSGSCSEIYLEKAFTSSHFEPPSRFPIAQELGETSLMLRVHPTLSATETTGIAEVVREVVKNATR